MGVGRPFSGHSSTFININPNPIRWELLELKIYDRTYAAKIKYHDCTNFEGIKIIVFEGVYKELPKILDPHFSETGNIVARFIPTHNGWKAANLFAEFLSDSLLKKEEETKTCENIVPLEKS